MSVAVIGGTGLSQLAGMDVLAEHRLETPFGMTSSPVLEGRYADCLVYFLPRHGADHGIAPHKINYRANIWALMQLGIEQVVAINAVGGIHPDAGPEAIILPDQIVDYSYGRDHTFFDGCPELKGRSLGDLHFDDVHHIDFTYPYSDELRQQLLQAGVDAKLTLVSQGVYGCTQGPRLETAAEVRRCQRDGCDVVGMTGMPEAALARELQLEYASVCLSVNWGAGLTEELISLDDIHRVITRGIGRVEELLQTFLASRSAYAGKGNVER